MKKRIKNWIALFIIMIALAALFNVEVKAGTPEDDLITVANSQGGKKAANYGFNADWCAWFVEWCASQAGLSGKGYFPGNKSYGRVTDLCNWFIDNDKGTAYYACQGELHISKNAKQISRTNFVPQKGDLICFTWSGNKTERYDHVGIVTGYSNNTVYYTHGNSGSTGSYTTNYVKVNTAIGKTSASIAAYIRPNYGGAGLTGCVDCVEGGEKSVYVKGWAFDEGEYSKQLEIHVYIGGPAGSANAEGYSILANKERTDVHQVYKSGEYHGYDDSISTTKTGMQEVYIYAIGKKNVLLGQKTVYIKKENKINLPERNITLNKGESKTINFTFQGDGIRQMTGTQNNNNISYKWEGFDWSVPKASITIEALQAGTTTLDINFVDDNSNIFYKDSITITVLPDPYSISFNPSIVIMNEGETKSLMVSFTGENLSQMDAVWNGTDDVAEISWGKQEQGSWKQEVILKGKTAGTNGLKIRLLDKGGNVLYSSTVYVTTKHVHSYTTQKVTKEPTCTASGIKGYVCSCGAVSSLTQVIPAKGHDYNTTWTIDKAATVTTEGEKSYHCKNCNARKDITKIPKIEHVHSGGKATCASRAVCSSCGLYYGKFGQHQYSSEWTIDQPSTCKEEGIKSHHCTICNDCKDKTKLPLGKHNYINGICTVCGEGKASEIGEKNTEAEGKIPEVGEKNPEVEGKPLEVGKMFRKEGLEYLITELTNEKGTVKVVRCVTKGRKVIKMRNKVKYEGVTFDITEIAPNAFANMEDLIKVSVGKNVVNIGANAFSNCKKLNHITIQSTKLKQVGSGAFKGIHKKAKIFIPKKKAKAYRKLLKGKGQALTVKIRS